MYGGRKSLCTIDLLIDNKYCIVMLVVTGGKDDLSLFVQDDQRE